MESKSSFPETTGMDALEAKKIIQQQNSKLNVILVKEGSPVTRDLRRNR